MWKKHALHEFCHQARLGINKMIFFQWVVVSSVFISLSFVVLCLIESCETSATPTASCFHLFDVQVMSIWHVLPSGKQNIQGSDRPTWGEASKKWGAVNGDKGSVYPAFWLWISPIKKPNASWRQSFFFLNWLFHCEKTLDLKWWVLSSEPMSDRATCSQQKRVKVMCSIQEAAVKRRWGPF